MGNEIMPYAGGEGNLAPLSAGAIREQVNLIQEVMKSVMEGPTKDNPTGVHYGIIPGTGNKPSLYKAGAEKLSLVFRLRPIMNDGADITVVELGAGHREYRVKCHIIDARGNEIATGVGSCSTMESKYRYRNSSDYEIIGNDIPKDAKERKDEYRKQGFGMKKVDGVWCWVKYKNDAKVENPDIADTYNTVLKMGKKRAYVDGILSATAASDIFTQDVEDLPPGYVSEFQRQPEPKKPAAGVQRKSEAATPQAQDTTAETEAATGPVEKTITAIVDKKYATRGKFVAWGMEGGVRVQSDDEAIIEKMNEAGKLRVPAMVVYIETTDGKYTNRNVKSVTLKDAEAPFENQQDPE